MFSTQPLQLLLVTTQAREGIETSARMRTFQKLLVTTQAREGIETSKNSPPNALNP